MTRGRRPAADAVKTAKGNTSKQKAEKIKPVVAEPKAVDRLPGYSTLRKRKLTEIGERTRAKQEQIRAFMQPRMESINFLKETDVNGFLRFCRYMAEWLVSLEVIDEEGFFYETSSPHTENMKRVHPAVQLRRINEQNLRMLEGEFGLTPARRQQMMMQMASAGLGIPPSATNMQPDDMPSAAIGASPLGFLAQPAKLN